MEWKIRYNVDFKWLVIKYKSKRKVNKKDHRKSLIWHYVPSCQKSNEKLFLIFVLLLRAEVSLPFKWKQIFILFLFQDSLGGNARTLMIACLSPSDTNHEESLSTLKYAHNAKFIKNRPVINDNIDPKDEMIRELQNEIKQLRNKLNN